MTEAADLVLTNAEIHTLGTPDETHEGVAVRDGRIVRVDTAYEVGFLDGVDTRVVDLDGRVLLPGFVDAHTHMSMVGRYEVHADLRGADGPGACLERLRAEIEENDGTGDAHASEAGNGEWVLGFGYDESTWTERRYLTRDDLDGVSTERPVAAFREDMHVASLNGVALDRLADDLPDGDVRREGGDPTGVVVEDAATAVFEAIRPGPAGTRELLEAAQERAHERGVTGVHDMVRDRDVARAWRELDRADELRLRVRLNYWSDFLDALLETGLRPDHGSEFVRVGAIKTFTDGSIGGRTAKLSAPYADAPEGEGADDAGDEPDDTGTWVVPPAELEALVERADREGFQVAAHAIGDAAIEAALDAFADAGDRRHRIEHAEVLTDELIERLGASDVVCSMQPNFLKWAREGGLYDSRLGVERRKASNRFGALADAGATLAFGSDCMPFDPLFGIDQVVDAPTEAQRLDVTDALRAYTSGAARAGFDEDRMGTIEPGRVADLVALDRSPWEADGVADIDVALTVVDGEVVHEDL